MGTGRSRKGLDQELESADPLLSLAVSTIAAGSGERRQCLILTKLDLVEMGIDASNLAGRVSEGQAIQ